MLRSRGSKASWTRISIESQGHSRSIDVSVGCMNPSFVLTLRIESKSFRWVQAHRLTRSAIPSNSPSTLKSSYQIWSNSFGSHPTRSNQIQSIHVFRIGIHHREYMRNEKCTEMGNEMCSEWAICEAPIMHYGWMLWLWKIRDITSDWIIHWNESCIDCYWKRKRGKRVFERDWNGWRWRNG